jgi:Streptomycin adenylyltransferase
MEANEIPGLAAWPEHRRVLAAAIDYFRQDARVPGLLLGGSFAAGTADFYSDIDLYVVVRDETFAGVLAGKTTAAAAGGRVLTAFVPDHLGPGGDEMYIAVYDGPVKMDFNYERRSALQPNWKLRGRVVLKDIDGALAGAVRASTGLAAPLPSRDVLEDVHNKFWTWCWYVFGKIARGELWEAVDGLHGIRKLALVPLLEWDANRPPEGFRRLEAVVPRGLRTRLAATLSGPETVPLYHALQATIDLFIELQRRVYPRYGVAVEGTAGQAIRSAIERAWRSRTP